jgi:ubiquinone/menaquinone biosynthesis C-methylase UbiE
MRLPSQEMWHSYDSVAAVYQDICVPMLFDSAARDLVSFLAVEPHDQVLDVGAGTGAASRWVKETGSRLHVAVDISIEMLRRNSAPAKIIGGCPHLPFPDHSFDVLLAGFILNHISEYQAALLDMVRLLRSGGRLGTTTWERRENEYAKRWFEIAESFAGKEFFQEVEMEVLPREGWFSDSEHVAAALRGPGLRDVCVERRSYCVIAKIQDYLLTREASMQGRFLRRKIGEGEWAKFQNLAQEDFNLRFQEPLNFTNVVLFGLGRRA